VDTAQAFAHELDYPAKDIRKEDTLYSSDAAGVLELIKRLDDKLDCVLLVGHNPTMTTLANDLGMNIDNLVTAGVVELRYDTDTWAAIGRATPVEKHYDYPKK
jgi:phosphohistidine phosphatase